MNNNTPHDDDINDDTVPFYFFDRSTSSYPFTRNTWLTDIIKDAIAQPCPGCLNETMKFSTTTALGKKSEQYYQRLMSATAFTAVNLACTRDECGQVSVLVVEVDPDDDYRFVEPVSEKRILKFIDGLNSEGMGHLYEMYKNLKYKDYKAMLVTTLPEDIFVERAYFPKAFTALEYIFKNNAQSQEQAEDKQDLAKAKASVREISSLIRSKNFGFANRARTLFEWILPKLFKLEFSGNTTLNDILDRARKEGEYSKRSKCGGPHFQPNIFNSILQKLQENHQETMNYKSMAGRLATLLEKHQSDSLTEDEKCILVENLHITCRKIREQLNKHSHFCADQKYQSDDYFLLATTLINSFFDVVIKLNQKSVFDSLIVQKS